MTTLIIGGTSGLGLELARKYKERGDEVLVLGRKDPDETGVQYIHFDLRGRETLQSTVDLLVGELPHIDTLVYAAGFFQEGTVTDLEPEDIMNMLDVGLNGAIWFVRELLEKQSSLQTFVAITSTSQWIPRKLEPVYTAVKAGLGHFANSMSLDGRISKTLVAGPAGMKTAFWRMTDRDTSQDNDPVWVAGQILAAMDDQFSYRFIQILRNPPQVNIVETRSE